MLSSFPPNHPKSILYSIHTIYHRLIRIVSGKRFHILDIVEVQNYNEARKGKDNNGSWRVRARYRKEVTGCGRVQGCMRRQ